MQLPRTVDEPFAEAAGAVGKRRRAGRHFVCDRGHNASSRRIWSGWCPDSPATRPSRPTSATRVSL